MEGESGEQVGGELDCDIISRVFYAFAIFERNFTLKFLIVVL